MSVPAHKSKSEFKWTLPICLTIIFMIVVVYSQVRTFDFTCFDDGGYISENVRIQNGMSWDSIIWAFGFSDDALAFYWHPATWLSLMLDVQLFGFNAGVHHLMNVFFHMLNAALLFLVLKQMTGALWKSAFIAILFAVHPLNVESVAWISERKNVLSTFFWILSMSAYTAYARKPDFKKYLLIFAPFILGLMSKPMLVTLPFVFLLTDYWPLKRLSIYPSQEIQPSINNKPLFQQSSMSRLILEKIPFLLLSAIVVGISVLSVNDPHKIVSSEMVPFTLRINNAIVIYVKYIAKLIWPHNMAIFYPFPESIPSWQVISAGVVLAGISITVLLLIKKAPYLLTGWLWYLGTLFPIIGIFQSGRWPEMADRWIYIPEIGLFIATVWGISAIFSKFHIHRLVAMAGAIIISVTLALITFIQLPHWKNDKALFGHAIAVTDNNPVAHYNFGFALAKEGKIEQAIWHYSEALKSMPDCFEIQNNMGIALAKIGQFEKAIHHFKKTISLAPDSAESYYNLANTYAYSGDLDKAITLYIKVLKMDPTHIRAQKNLEKVSLAKEKAREKRINELLVPEH